MAKSSENKWLVFLGKMLLEIAALGRVENLSIL